MKLRLFQDPRDYQILFLVCFLFLGVWVRDFSVKPANVLAIVLSCLATQMVVDRIDGKNSIRSSLITAISLALLLRSISVITMVLVGVLSIGSKAVLRYRGKHFFNPSNLGLVIALALSIGWVTPGQWGNDMWLFFLFACTGGLITRKVGRWDTTAAFLGVYLSMEAARNYWLGWTADVFVHKMMSGSLLLFAFFMITDPRAIPDRRGARIAWAVSVAVLTYVLRNRYFMPTALFWALFALSPVTVLLDRLWPASRFEWKQEKSKVIRTSQEVVA